MADNFAEYILDSTSQQIKNSISKLHFDQTIIAKILQTYEDAPTKYLVQKDNLMFYAYSDTTYSVGTNVQVLIPNGDYEDANRRILGIAHSTATQEPVKTLQYKDIIWDKPITDDSLYQYNSKFDYVGLKLFLSGSFKNMPKFTIKASLLDEYYIELKSIRFTQDDVFGNMQSFNPAFPFTVVAEFPDDLVLTKVKHITCRLISVSEGKDTINLKDTNGTQLIDSLGQELKGVVPEFEIKNWSLCFGYKKETESFIKLYADAGFTGLYQASPQLYVEYYKEGKLHTNRLGNVDYDEVALLKYAAGYEPEPESAFEQTYWKIADASHTEGYYAPIFDTGAARTLFKASLQLAGVVEGTDKQESYYIDSNIITYTQQVENPLTDEGELTFRLEDDGRYFYYGMDGKIYNDTYQSKERHIQVLLNSGEELTDTEKATIVWTVPTRDTGLVATSTTGTDILTYRLNNICFREYTNNTVYCELTRDNGEVLKDSFTFTFGGANTQDSKYSLNIIYDQENSFCFLKEDGSIPDGDINLKAIFESVDGDTLDVVPSFTWDIEEGTGSLSSDTGESVDLMLSPISKDEPLVISVSVKYLLSNGETCTLKDYLPITFVNSKYKNFYFTGPQRVVYDMSGVATYDKTEYKAYSDNAEIPASWSLTGSPHVLNSRNKLQIAESTLVGEKPEIGLIQAVDENGDIICTTSLITLYNSWSIKNLNGWTGKMVEYGEDYILSPMIASGKKEDDNSFTGAMLGSFDENETFGFYGFQKGQPRFKLTENAEFYVGNGKNYISFDPTKNELLDIKTQNFNLYSKVSLDTRTNLSLQIVSPKKSADRFLWIEEITQYSDTGGISGSSPLQLFANGTIQAKKILVGEESVFSYGASIGSEDFFGFYAFQPLLEQNISSIMGIGIGLKKGQDEINNYEPCSDTAGELLLGDSDYCHFSIRSAVMDTTFSEGDVAAISGITEYIGGSELNLVAAGINIGYSDSTGYLYGTWYSSSPIATTSDKNKKNSFHTITENYDFFYDNLLPTSFKYNDGTSGRTHIGFISQEVQEALDMAEISSQNFAGLVVADRGTKNEVWYLRYEEFIALNTWQIQKLKARVSELESEIKELKEK